jgi:putative membrane protein
LTSAPDSIHASNQRGAIPALWILLALYAGANILPLFPQAFPAPAYPASQIITALLFALVHGAIVYRLRGIVSFAVITMGVGYFMEALGVRTGFPFGHYVFTGQMGPQFFHVPILMGPAYLGIGYIAWTLAGVILKSGDPGEELAGARIITLPLSAAFIMVAWDLTIDPALSTVGRYWVWTRGGAYFGVPATNFLGWFLTNYLAYQLFALYLRVRSNGASPVSRSAARLAVFVYAVCALGSVLRIFPKSVSSTVTDPAGTVWRVNDINAVCALAAIFIMGAFVIFALARLAGHVSDSRELTRQKSHHAVSNVLDQQHEFEQAQ